MSLKSARSERNAYHEKLDCQNFTTLVFMIYISGKSVRSDRSFCGFLLLADACVNYLTIYPQS